MVPIFFLNNNGCRIMVTGGFIWIYKKYFFWLTFLYQIPIFWHFLLQNCRSPLILTMLCSFLLFNILSWFLVNIWGAAQNGTAYIQKVMGVQIYGIPYNYKLIFSCIIAASSSPKNFKMVPLLHKWCQMKGIRALISERYTFRLCINSKGCTAPKKGSKISCMVTFTQFDEPCDPPCPIYIPIPHFYFII